MEKITLSIKNWIRENPLEAIFLTSIILVGAFLRLYRIDAYMTFLGDEGRDVIIVRRLLVNFDPILIGPGTSIGNMYLGPLYYYMMAPALLLANFSPVGPAVQIAILGTITIAFVWWVGREWFGKLAGIISAGLYAVAPTVITYSHSSWNPNIMPFFALLSIYSIWKVFRKQDFRWLIVLGVSFAAILQSHYLGLLLLPTLGIFWLLTFKEIRDKREVKRSFLNLSLIALLLFTFLMSPLVIFDARHGWHNFGAIWNFFTARQSTVSFRPWNAIPNFWPIWQEINLSLLAAKNTLVGSIMTVLITLGATILIYINIVRRIRRKSGFRGAYLLLFTWLGFALLGLALYKQQIYDHYFGFIFPAPFLLTGAIASKMLNSKYEISKVIVFLWLIFLVFIDLQNSPIRSFPNMQLTRSQIVAKKILDESGGKPFDLAVLAERNYEDGYRYFLLVWGATVLHADVWDQKTVVDQLFVVCEMPKEKCDPTHSSKAEVANFGMSKIDSEWDDVFGVRVYKLVHSK